MAYNRRGWRAEDCPCLPSGSSRLAYMIEYGAEPGFVAPFGMPAKSADALKRSGSGQPPDTGI